MREETAGTYRVVRNTLAANNINIAQLRTILTLSNAEAVGIAVQQGVGVGFVSQAIYTHVVYGKVKPIRLRGIEFVQDIYICRHQMQAYGSVQNAFWDYATSITPAALAAAGDYLFQLREGGTEPSGAQLSKVTASR
jgi:DNA-binding transcriptional LysR family regulator